MCVTLGGVSRLLPLILLLIPGGCGSSWSVVYTGLQVCAVRNTTAVFQCSFAYPGGYNVKEVKWAHGESHLYYGPFIFDSNDNKSSKFQYIGDKTKNCSLKIHHAEQSDAGRYAFRFITDIEVGRYTGAKGPVLQVTDLKLSSSSGNGTVKEGDSLNLTCRNECNGTERLFTWFKNGQRLQNGPVLGLISVSSDDSGNYSCSLSQHRGTTSGDLHINVEYGPKNTSVSVRPSLEVDSGTNFTLTCSSHANPTVEGYVWFQVTGDEQLAVKNQTVLVSSVGGQYFCRASNKHGSQDSAVVTLTIKEQRSNTQIAVIIFIVALSLVVILLSFITWFWMKRSKRAAEETPQAADHMSTVYANWQASEGKKRPQARNDCNGEAAPAEVIYTTVVFGREKMQQKRQQQEDTDDGITIYSLASK